MRLREIREQKRYSQRDLAKLVGTSQQQIDRWEKGQKFPMDMAFKVANALKHPIEDLLRYQEIEIGADSVSEILQKRDLTNIALAKMIGVEGWTIGAWLKGQRKISKKYRAKLWGLLQSDPKDSLDYISVLEQINNLEVKELLELQQRIAKLISDKF